MESRMTRPIHARTQRFGSYGQVSPCGKYRVLASMAWKPNPFEGPRVEVRVMRFADERPLEKFLAEVGREYEGKVVWVNQRDVVDLHLHAQ